MNNLSYSCGYNPYESGIFANQAKGLLHPGGLSLTKSMLDVCYFPRGARVLDIGCGTGRSVELMRDQYGLEAVGIDISFLLLGRAKECSTGLSIILGSAEEMPFADSSFDGVLAECSLSVMHYSDKVLTEINRILTPGGKLCTSDIYFRNAESIAVLRNIQSTGCIAGALTYPELAQRIASNGFTIKNWTDRSGLLKEFVAGMIMNSGSFTWFWQFASVCKEDACVLQSSTIKAKPGYCCLIAEKNYL